jgi:hypothetical protein
VSASTVKPAARTRARPSGHGLQPGVRHREHLAHADPHAAPVERIGAGRRQQHGVDAERGRTAEHRADVGVVVDVLQDRHAPGAASTSSAVRSGSRWNDASTPAVHVETGGPVEHVGVAAYTGRRRPGRRAGRPVWRRPGTTGPVAGAQRPPQDQLALGDEQPVRRLPPGTQLEIGERPVVAEAFVVRVGDQVDRARRSGDPVGQMRGVAGHPHVQLAQGARRVASHSGVPPPQDHRREMQPELVQQALLEAAAQHGRAAHDHHVATVSQGHRLGHRTGQTVHNEREPVLQPDLSGGFRVTTSIGGWAACAAP